ncbi:NAD(P)/FAD-dependent oxidoreductase [Alteromonas sp. 5E99-2]|uniref:NAD(P)/FAD-dependent oxidoreductase n=1 Tax=Alteromonas sp. 5E99-2 TaxID=2817683 RepID=UPI001A980C13|nr:NAD(P)/FAD-dependent oxidoreductase [Alteromonas sp. 5E99-2]MBO1255900.1 NAD(P)/FAD-dependent oxidoreductase [Alteromonas sp. 5E99-2]
MQHTNSVNAPKQRDVIVIGAGAAGLFCAAQAGARGRRVEVIDHAKKIGRKILMSGGGRCNFTNMFASHENFLGQNPHFCKSALSRYTQWDFIALVEKYGIAYHEKTLGQLFCDDSAKDIVKLLTSECDNAGVLITTQCEVIAVEKYENGYSLTTSQGLYQCESLVIATGGLSMPKLGATPFGFKIAEQFGLSVEPTQAALVPFTLHDHDKTDFAELSGVSLEVNVGTADTEFKEDMLFTHRGLSGPSMLQISSYWQAGEAIHINTLPNHDTEQLVQQWRNENKDALLTTCLSQVFPKRMSAMLVARHGWENKPMRQHQDSELKAIATTLHSWNIKPNGTEGYRTAEVTLGGVSTQALSSKTMMARNVEGLYFIGEVVDVTGWLGGYNFQWAWSSGWAAGQVV